MTSDKKHSWSNVAQTRGVPVLTWGVLTNGVCQSTFDCSSGEIYRASFAIALEARAAAAVANITFAYA
ncbi:hypothetical protein EYZ11_002275 [Aspergillus tanneri]|uniref:Uncharacterized protein n=1 Tax=Aspergillus tanneri TaxID=1220188 RepID=A0A4S3JR76_9EURO|nr:hypothetical protein EYZ11_002275 [Aspergillus tanneri]